MDRRNVQDQNKSERSKPIIKLKLDLPLYIYLIKKHLSTKFCDKCSNLTEFHFNITLKLFSLNVI